MIPKCSYSPHNGRSIQLLVVFDILIAKVYFIVRGEGEMGKKYLSLLIFLLILLSNLLFNQNKELGNRLYEAIKRGDNKIALLLIKSNAFLDIEGYKNPLILAAKKGNSEIVNALIQAGANVNIRGKEDETALMNAARSGDIKSVRLLIKSNAKLNLINGGGTALRRAVGMLKYSKNKKSEYLNIMQTLIDAGAQPDKYYRPEGNEGWTPLYTAVDQNQLEAIKILLKAGADPNIKSNDRWGTAITRVQSIEAARLLIKGGAIDTGYPFLAGFRWRYYKGRWKEMSKTLNIIAYLCNNGFSARGGPGNKVLKHVIEKYFYYKRYGKGEESIQLFRIIRALANANVSLRGNIEGCYSPLNEAIVYKAISLVKLLVKNGADVNYANAPAGYRGRCDTPLQIAIASGQTEIAEILIKAGAKR